MRGIAFASRCGSLNVERRHRGSSAKAHAAPMISVRLILLMPTRAHAAAYNQGLVLPWRAAAYGHCAFESGVRASMCAPVESHAAQP